MEKFKTLIDFAFWTCSRRFQVADNISRYIAIQSSLLVGSKIFKSSLIAIIAAEWALSIDKTWQYNTKFNIYIEGWCIETHQKSFNYDVSSNFGFSNIFPLHI